MQLVQVCLAAASLPQQRKIENSRGRTECESDAMMSGMRRLFEVVGAGALICACGTSASVSGPAGEGAEADGGPASADGAAAGADAAAAVFVLPDTPAAGSIRGRPITFRSVSLRLETDRRILTLREYASNCGVVAGALPPADSVVVHVVVRRDSPGEEIIVFADNHSATFQIGIDPATTETFPATGGRLRLDTFSTTPGAIVTGAVALASSVGTVSGTFEATVCASQ